MRAIVVVVFATACGGGSSNNRGKVDVVDGGVSTGCLSSNECPVSWTCNEFGQCVPPAPGVDAGTPPPEVEYDFGAPISSQRYVYVPETAQDKLARIDGQTLAVISTQVGESPRVVATIPGSDGAVVLDQVNGTATIVRPDPAGDTLRVLPTLQSLNRLDIDPTGQYAVIWFDLVKAVQDGGLGGIGSFQDVTVVALASGAEKAVNLTVGFEPRNVQFDAAGGHAYVVTRDGVSVVDLAYATQHEPTIVPAIPVADASVPVEDLEVAVVATGDFAAVRQMDVAALRVVSLRAADAGAAWTIPLSSAPTDIDLAPDGSRVYAVERDARQLAIVDIPGDAFDPSGVDIVDLTNATLGSLVLSRDGTRALLFTNATHDMRLSMVKLDQPGYPTVTWPLRKAVRAVGISPSGGSAIVLGAKAFGDPSTATSIDDYIDKSYGYSLVDLATGFAKLQITDVDPGPFVYSLDGAKAYVALDGGDDPTSTRAAQIVTVQNGVITTVQLGSPPAALGILPVANVAFVSQRHPLGRVSFVSLVTDALRTVTGFDLNGQVVQ
jgi:hypothetical protein